MLRDRSRACAMESPNIAGGRNKALNVHRLDNTELPVFLRAAELPMTLAFWNTALSLEISESLPRRMFFKAVKSCQ